MPGAARSRFVTLTSASHTTPAVIQLARAGASAGRSRPPRRSRCSRRIMSIARMGPTRSARKPTSRIPSGPIPMQTVNNPIRRERICAGACSTISDVCMLANAAEPKPPDRQQQRRPAESRRQRHQEHAGHEHQRAADHQRPAGQPRFAAGQPQAAEERAERLRRRRARRPVSAKPRTPAARSARPARNRESPEGSSRW